MLVMLLVKLLQFQGISSHSRDWTHCIVTQMKSGMFREWQQVQWDWDEILYPGDYSIIFPAERSTHLHTVHWISNMKKTSNHLNIWISLSGDIHCCRMRRKLFSQFSELKSVGIFKIFLTLMRSWQADWEIPAKKCGDLLISPAPSYFL